MRKSVLAICLFLFIACVAEAQTTDIEKTAEGISLKLTDRKSSIPQQIRLQVISDQIIRVSASPLQAAQPQKSLMITDSLKGSSNWQLRQSAGEAVISTSALNAHLDLNTGQVWFTDKAGGLILKEAKRDGSAFIADTYSGDTFYRIKQTFEGDADEALYGLGQHQTDVMNYRGHQVDLSQYNTDVAIPFLLSSRNYGLLWDNYSITKVGDVRQLQPLETLRLYSKEGEAGWLTASYSSRTGNSPAIERAESVIDYSYLDDMKNFPDSFRLADGKVRWEGSIESPYDGLHRFHIKYAGYLKVWLNGKQLADRWRQPWNAGNIELPFEFEKGKKYPIAIEWIPDGGESYLALKWQSPIPADQQNRYSFSSEAGDHIDYYFIVGNNADEVISGYRRLTGKAPIVPGWAMGFWQSRERYKTQDEVLNTAKTFREKKIPLDNIVLDWSYWAEDQWGSQEFEASRFPNPDQMIDDLHTKYNTRFMISVWPKFYRGIDTYNRFKEKGWLYMRNIADGRKDWIAGGYSSTFYDPFNPQARAGFWDLLNTRLYKKGVDAWWLDATEPDMHSNLPVEVRKTLFSPAIGSGVRYFNAYPLQNAKGVYEGQRATKPDDRVFILTRSAYAGLQRYAAVTWSGDISSRWHDMKDQISAGINFSLSGLPYWTMDIGGFSVEKRYEKAEGADLDEWREMNARWYQFGAFTPIFRVHGQFPFREIYNIAPEGHPAYGSMLYYNKLRYRLMPYIYSLAGHSYHNDYTIMRGLIMDFSHDPAVKNIGDQFMFGPSLLVNPVYQYGAKSRELYLPAGTGWYDFYSGRYTRGGSTISAAAPYERMPLYVKEGSIIPFGPQLQYTSEKPADPLTLYVYTGRDASFTLYEDERTNYNYEKGQYATIPFNYNEKTKTLSIGGRKGSFPGMLAERRFRIVWLRPGKGQPFNLEEGVGQELTYTGKAVSLKM